MEALNEPAENNTINEHKIANVISRQYVISTILKAIGCAKRTVFIITFRQSSLLTQYATNGYQHKISSND
jgi:hypothetical protein